MDKNKEINWDYKRRLAEERHETIRLFGVTFGIVAVICSIVWGLVLYNLEAVKHPVDYSNKVEVETNYNRGR